MKKSMFAVVSAIAAAAAFADPSISQMVARQQWPWSEKVMIDFHLSGVTAATEVDVAVYRGETKLTVPQTAITGDFCELTADGDYSITFDPSCLSDRPAKGENLRFVLTPSTSSASSNWSDIMYKIIDLETYTVTDVTRGAIVRGEYGSYETDYSKIGEGYNTTFSDVLIWTGVTNNPAYKTTKLVMRHIPAGTYPWYTTWTRWDKQTNEMTNDFYIGVFELTQGQMAAMTNNLIAKAGLSPTYVTSDYYNPQSFEGSTKPLSQWSPSALFGHYNERYLKVTNSRGVLGILNNKIAEIVNGHYFTLPGFSQWYYACWAGTDTFYYDGLGGSARAGIPAEASHDDRLDVLGRYKANGGIVDNGDGTTTTNGTVAVGSYRPNAFGLYDMIGNVHEYLLDYLGAPAQKDGLPADATYNNSYFAGGSYLNGAYLDATNFFKPGNRQTNYGNGRHSDVGYRLMLWIEPEGAGE